VNKTIEDFIGTYLHIEVAYEDLGPTRDLIKALSPAYAESLRQGFVGLLESRELSAGDYDGMTHVEFETDDELYGYLQAVFEFLFQGAQASPQPPL
jgi:hypothetical protein